MREVPVAGKGSRGKNAWEWFQSERGEQNGQFVRTKTTEVVSHGRPNRHARRKAIAMKRKGLL